ncbi:5-(carboxyamino)imidazole ribonucleotide mutase [Gloeomargarita lithophora]
MGSDSDLPVMHQCAQVCEDFHLAYDLAIVSAHRTPHRMVTYAETAHQRGLRVIVAGAGGAAHLPGMVAALTPLPVIGVPIASPHLQGVDALYSMVQMPKGIPVATVAIGNATNAGLLAVQILACGDGDLLKRIQTYRQNLTQQVLEKQERLSQQGWRAYLNP